jgi:hypothetical protein
LIAAVTVHIMSLSYSSSNPLAALIAAVTVHIMSLSTS